jgi:hypothetical protein
MAVRFLIVLLTIVGAAATAASANTPPSTTFSAVLRATVEQHASFEVQAPSGDCAYVFTGGWTNELEIHSARPTIMVVTSRSGRLRFSPAGIYALDGKLTARGGGYSEAPGCPTFASDCLRPQSTFRRGRVAIASPRPGTLTLGRIRHKRLRPCGTGEALGSRTADVDLAPARIATSRLLGTSRRPVVVTGSYEASEDLGPPNVDSGTLDTKVSWSLTFTRIRR